MSIFYWQIFAAVAGLAALYYGADFLVRGGVVIARRAGISPLVIGLTLVAFATSAPELVVSVSAGLIGNADIAIGNIVGSNICNVALILGLCGCIAPLKVKTRLLRLDAPLMLMCSVLLVSFYFADRGLERWQGILFFCGLIAYTVWSIKSAKVAPEIANEISQPKLRSIPIALLLVFGGLGALIVGAKLLLISAVYFARLLELSDAVIALTVVAIGTSLPELATSVVAAVKNEHDIAIGNILGSNIFNILGILGLSATLSPLHNANIDAVDLGVMVAYAAILLPMLRSNWQLSRWEGALLLFSYCGYVGYLILSHA